MSYLNLYYKAFKSYRVHTGPDKFCVKSRNNIKKATSDDDRLEATRNYCVIDEDWVKKIEWGLPFIEKAIDEERQFIKSEGEVLNIEKVKHVSKDSVSHLARHSEFITREPKEESDIVPDKLYMVKRDSDFAVYENRFLYMLLCYIRDFIAIRLKKIHEKGNAYNGKLNYKRSFQLNGGSLSFEGKFEENTLSNPFGETQGDYKLIERIEESQHIVASLLNKPLINIVSKTPMLKPPITKTNVLKMDIKFKNALELYEYLSAYKGDGFRVEQRKKIYTDFTGELADQLAEIINLTSFITCEYGMEVTEKLQRDFEREQEVESEKELAELEQRTKTLKHKLALGKITPEEYIVSMEDTLKAYREQNESLKKTRSAYEILSIKYTDLLQTEKELNEKIIVLNGEVAAKETELKEQEIKYINDMAKAEERRINDLNAASERYDAEVRLLTDNYEQKLTDAENRRVSEVDELTKASDEKIGEISARFDELTKDHDLLLAEFAAYKRLNGETDENNYTAKEDFEKLERQFSAYYEFFCEKWKDAKKTIRSEYLWRKAKYLKNKI